MDLFKYTAHELHEKLVNKEITAVELTNAVYARIEEVNAHVKTNVYKKVRNFLTQ